MSERAIVTAGGTRDHIDDVRVITTNIEYLISNSSTGSFGAEIAKALNRQGVHTRLIASHELAKKTVAYPAEFDGIITVPFDGFKDLKRSLENEVAPDILFMAAAVSDYSPIPTEGKISSDQDELVIRMKRNPKLLSTLREQFGITTFLVGFKLLSGVSREQLIAVARKQLHDNHLNLVVANDLQHIGAHHPIIVVTPEGGAIDFGGTKAEVAEQLVRFVLRRARVRWYRSVQHRETPEFDFNKNRAARLLKFAQDCGLLVDVNGNISLESLSQPSCHWVTPRQVDKSKIDVRDLIMIHAYHTLRTIYFDGPRKPSIDSSVHTLLYARNDNLKALLHFHGGYVLPNGTTTFPYPCGCVEEADEIQKLVPKDGSGFAVHLLHHGYLVGLTEKELTALYEDWDALLKEHHQHLMEVDSALVDTVKKRTPIFAGPHIVGLVADREDGAHSLYLANSSRGKQYGAAVLQLAIKRGLTIWVHEKCEVLDFYLKRGFTIVRQEGAVTILHPPVRRARPEV